MKIIAEVVLRQVCISKDAEVVMSKRILRKTDWCCPNAANGSSSSHSQTKSRREREGSGICSCLLGVVVAPGGGSQHTNTRCAHSRVSALL